jgi:hypothetical protein
MCAHHSMQANAEVAIAVDLLSSSCQAASIHATRSEIIEKGC